MCAPGVIGGGYRRGVSPGGIDGGHRRGCWLPGTGAPPPLDRDGGGRVLPVGGRPPIVVTRPAHRPRPAIAGTRSPSRPGSRPRRARAAPRRSLEETPPIGWSTSVNPRVARRLRSFLPRRPLLVGACWTIGPPRTPGRGACALG